MTLPCAHPHGPSPSGHWLPPTPALCHLSATKPYSCSLHCGAVLPRAADAPGARSALCATAALGCDGTRLRCGRSRPRPRAHGVAARPRGGGAVPAQLSSAQHRSAAPPARGSSGIFRCQSHRVDPRCPRTFPADALPGTCAVTRCEDAGHRRLSLLPFYHPNCAGAQRLRLLPRGQRRARALPAQPRGRIKGTSVPLNSAARTRSPERNALAGLVEHACARGAAPGQVPTSRSGIAQSSSSAAGPCVGQPLTSLGFSVRRALVAVELGGTAAHSLLWPARDSALALCLS